ncbi:YjfB family protein [Salinispira pacifica]|nr:YjfB family protein [Salinispira pacifica]
MSSISNIQEMSTAMSNQQVRQEAAVNILDSSLDTAQAQADQLIQMMEFKDPMVGNLVDVKA